ncbi:hypothetical protein MKEN_00217600 [Mycena kentingensis (nom. inval.)]|nr:hypothetical protein MKEN_00217600 [Mycena kentingensis (nom. inval.)]
MQHEPRLPEDLERTIFELVFFLDAAQGPKLLLVARRVQLWIEPLIYRTIELCHPSRTAAILDAARGKPDGFLAKHVRDVVLLGSGHNGESLLQECTGLVGLAIAGGAYTDTICPTILALPNLRRLACHPTQLIWHLPTPPLILDPAFRHISHLDLFSGLKSSATREAENTRMCAFLATLPALTHLSLHHGLPWPVVRNVLSALPRLRVLVDRSTPAFAPGRAETLPPDLLRDVRLVILTSGTWYEAALEGAEVWLLAEKFVDAKRSGRIPADVFIPELA